MKVMAKIDAEAKENAKHQIESANDRLKLAQEEVQKIEEKISALELFLKE